MQFHRGRLLDHLQLVVRDLVASRRFYEATMAVLEIPPGPSGADYFSYDELWISTAQSYAATGELTGRGHIAFVAKDRETVDAWYAQALAAGGRDNGPPGLRAKYHRNYYAAFVLDPDGNNVEAVHHGPAQVSAPSVVVDYSAG